MKSVLTKLRLMKRSIIDQAQLKRTDPDIYNAIRAEVRRQNENIELIASENFTSLSVLEAMGSVLTNKYAEGYPAKRWYGGCENVDVVEQLAIDRAQLHELGTGRRLAELFFHGGKLGVHIIDAGHENGLRRRWDGAGTVFAHGVVRKQDVLEAFEERSL